MKRLILSLYLVIASFAFTNAQSNKIEIGTVDTLYSKILNEKREVWVYVPHQATSNIFSEKRYPVLYLLDGDWHFFSVVGTTHQLSFVNGNSICPEMIIVGIINTDRTRDYTPSCDSSFSPTSGANEKFLAFIEKELIPYIESAYPVEPYRMLIGHSFGGLTVINTLLNHPNLFNAYVAIDPGMWWNNQSLLKEAKIALVENKFTNISLFMAIANSMERDMDTLKVKTDTSRNTLHIRSILELASLFKQNKQNGLNYQDKYYPNDDHGSLPHIAFYDALHFIFDFYNLNLTKNDYADTSMNLPYRIEKHYKNISEKMGYEIKPSENNLNTYGYTALMRKNYKQAEYFFKLNMKNYPESYNVYDSFGDYYLATGDKLKAAAMFTKALSILENPDTRQKLKTLQGDK